MNHRFSFLSSAAVFALFAAPLAAWADIHPDFDDDATPILRMQPNLLQYVRSSFDVKDTGIAKFPGDDDHAPGPPFIFSARPRGSNGPFNLRLMIQPGPPGHILAVVDITKVHLTAPAPHAPSAPPAPAVAAQPPVQPQPAPVQTAPVSQPPQPAPSQPTADTPSGPINSSGQVTPLPSPPPSTAPSLAPPPDPAPEPH